MLGGNAIAGTQAPVDVIKALAGATPSSRKSSCRSVRFPHLAIDAKLSVGAFFQLEDRKERDPAVGSYSAFADFVRRRQRQKLLVAPAPISAAQGSSTATR